jgi:hypothetical protein
VNDPLLQALSAPESLHAIRMLAIIAFAGVGLLTACAIPVMIATWNSPSMPMPPRPVQVNILDNIRQ